MRIGNSELGIVNCVMFGIGCDCQNQDLGDVRMYGIVVGGCEVRGPWLAGGHIHRKTKRPWVWDRVLARFWEHGRESDAIAPRSLGSVCYGSTELCDHVRNGYDNCA